jgi:hypothetical protein
MADLRAGFTILEDSSTQAGLPLHKVLEADAAAAKNALPALVAKDAGGLLRYIKTNTAGEVSVVVASGKVCVSARGSVAGSATFVDVATITLVNGETYQDLDWVVSCFRDAVFEVVRVEDVGGADTEIIVADMLVGPGDFTDSGVLKCEEFTAPATDVNVLKIRAKNVNALSDFRATITIGQIL